MFSFIYFIFAGYRFSFKQLIKCISGIYQNIRAYSFKFLNQLHAGIKLKKRITACQGKSIHRIAIRNSMDHLHDPLL